MGRGFTVEFQTGYSLIENQVSVESLHRGKIKGFDPRHFELEVHTEMRLASLGNQIISVTTQVTADGEFLWTESTYPSMEQASVLKLPIDQADALARVDSVMGNQISPLDLDPLLLWRLAAEYCTFGEVQLLAQDRVVLTGHTTAAFHRAAAHRSIFFQPEVVLLTLSKSTGQPQALELRTTRQKTTLHSTFSRWQALDLGLHDFGYLLTAGVEVRSPTLTSPPAGQNPAH
jgi:hypothetical protein